MLGTAILTVTMKAFRDKLAPKACWTPELIELDSLSTSAYLQRQQAICKAGQAKVAAAEVQGGTAKHVSMHTDQWSCSFFN